MVDGDVNVREVRTFRQETRLPNSPHGPYRVGGTVRRNNDRNAPGLVRN